MMQRTNGIPEAKSPPKKLKPTPLVAFIYYFLNFLFRASIGSANSNCNSLPLLHVCYVPSLVRSKLLACFSLNLLKNSMGSWPLLLPFKGWQTKAHTGEGNVQGQTAGKWHSQDANLHLPSPKPLLLSTTVFLSQCVRTHRKTRTIKVRLLFPHKMSKKQPIMTGSTQSIGCCSFLLSHYIKAILSTGWISELLEFHVKSRSKTPFPLRDPTLTLTLLWESYRSRWQMI